MGINVFCVCLCVNRDSSPWMCTFCVFKNNQRCYYRDELKKEAALSHRISQHMLVSTLQLSVFTSQCLRHAALTQLLSFLTTGMSLSPPAPVQRWWGTNICHRPQPLCEFSLYSFCTCKTHLISYLRCGSSVEDVNKTRRCFVAFHHFWFAVARLLCCDQDSDVAGQHSRQVPAAALPDCWRVCVRRPAHLHQLCCIQPGKKLYQ